MVIQVINVNGRLVGRRFQDRWNLASLGYTHFNVGNIREEMKGFRKASGEDFIIDTNIGKMEGINASERAMFGSHVARLAA